MSRALKRQAPDVVHKTFVIYILFFNSSNCERDPAVAGLSENDAGSVTNREMRTRIHYMYLGDLCLKNLVAYELSQKHRELRPRIERELFDRHCRFDRHSIGIVDTTPGPHQPQPGNATSAQSK